MENINTCSLCFETYGETSRPRVLPCGHTYCTDCLSKIILNGNPLCPMCNTSFSASNASQVPINYTLEKCISAMKEKLGGISKPPPPDKMKTLQDIIDSQKLNAHDLLLSSEAFNSDVLVYQKYLENTIQKNKDLVKKLYQRAAWHEGLIKLMLKEQEKVKEVQKQVTLLSKDLQASLPELDCKTDNKAVASASAKLIENFGDLANCLSKYQKELPDFKISISEKALKRSLELLSDDESPVSKKNFCSSIFIDDPMTIMEKLTMLHNSTMTITGNELQSKPNTWKRRIDAGKLFVVSSTDDNKRSASVTMRNGKMYLHCLQDQEVPSCSYVVEHKEFVRNAGKDSMTVFLDWELSNSSSKGHIHITMLSKSPLAKHFMEVCTGELGPTYINKTLSICGSTISCKPYDKCDISGSDPLKQINLSDAMYKCKSEIGTTWLNIDGSFHINVDVIGNSYGSVFGKAQDGIDGLINARKNHFFSLIRVIDSGIVIES